MLFRNFYAIDILMWSVNAFWVTNPLLSLCKLVAQQFWSYQKQSGSKKWKRLTVDQLKQLQMENELIELWKVEVKGPDSSFATNLQCYNKGFLTQKAFTDHIRVSIAEKFPNNMEPFGFYAKNHPGFVKNLVHELRKSSKFQPSFWPKIPKKTGTSQIG
jgi:hypothetical protein